MLARNRTSRSTFFRNIDPLIKIMSPVIFLVVLNSIATSAVLLFTLEEVVRKAEWFEFFLQRLIAFSCYRI